MTATKVWGIIIIVLGILLLLWTGNDFNTFYNEMTKFDKLIEAGELSNQIKSDAIYKAYGLTQDDIDATYLVYKISAGLSVFMMILGTIMVSKTKKLKDNNE